MCHMPIFFTSFRSRCTNDIEGPAYSSASKINFSFTHILVLMEVWSSHRQLLRHSLIQTVLTAPPLRAARPMHGPSGQAC